MTKPTSIQGLNRCSRLIAACVPVLVSSIVIAQQQSVPNAVALESEEEEIRRYSVEMIVFEYVGSAAGSTEIFTPEQPVDPLYEDDFLINLPEDLTRKRAMMFDPEEERMISGAQPYPDEQLVEVQTFEQSGLVLLDPEDYQLTNTYRKLVELDAYRPLVHTAWLQPTLEREDTQPILLRRIGDPPLRLDGTVSLYLSRFLHLVIDLSLEEKSPQRMVATQDRIRGYGDNRSRAAFSFDPEFVTPSTFYRIQEDRIVRNNELRYYDHPKFGVLAKITRIEKEAPDDIDTTGDLLPGPN